MVSVPHTSNSEYLRMCGHLAWWFRYQLGYLHPIARGSGLLATASYNKKIVTRVGEHVEKWPPALLEEM